MEEAGSGFEVTVVTVQCPLPCGLLNGDVPARLLAAGRRVLSLIRRPPPAVAQLSKRPDIGESWRDSPKIAEVGICSYAVEGMEG